MSEETKGATVEGQPKDEGVKMDDVLKRLDALEKEKESLRNELSTRDKKITELVGVRNELETKAKEIEESKLSDLEKMQLQLNEVTHQLTEQQRQTMIAKNKASALEVFEKESLPIELIDFVPLDSRDSMGEKIDKLKAIVDGIRTNIKDSYAKCNGDRVSTGAKIGELSNVKAEDMTADQVTQLYKTDPEAAMRILRNRKGK